LSHLLGYQTSACEGIQRSERVRLAQARIPGAMGELQHLCEELHLPDPAAANLDVAIDRAVRLLHACFVPEHLLERGMIQIPAVDERPDEHEESLAQPGVSPNRPRLDERETFERLAPCLVVLGDLLERVRNVAAAPHGPQSKIDAIQVPLVTKLGEERHQLAPEL